MSRRFYKREIPKDLKGTNERNKTSLMCVRDINEILSPLYVYIETIKNDNPLKIKMPNGSRIMNYTYYIKPKSTPEISYSILQRPAVLCEINTLFILGMLIKPNQCINEVFEEEQETNTKYTFIPE